MKCFCQITNDEERIYRYGQCAADAHPPLRQRTARWSTLV